MPIELIVAILGRGVLSTIISGLFTWLQSKKAVQNNLTDGLKILLYDRIKHLGKAHISRGCITFEDLEDLVEMHNIYHDSLNGNGYLDKLMSQVGKLDIVERYDEYE